MEPDIICNEKKHNIPEEILCYLKTVLPYGYKSKIIKFHKLTSSTYDLALRLNIRNKEDALKWLQCYEEQSYTSWRSLRTYPEDSRRIIFKKDFRCHHNTMPKANAVPSEKHSKCSARIKITVKQPLQKLSKDVELKERPCEILFAFTHNHSLKSADVYKYLKPKKDVVATLKHVFGEGHSPLSVWYNSWQQTKIEQCGIFSFNQASISSNEAELGNTNYEDSATLTQVEANIIEREKSKNDAKIILKTMCSDIELLVESNPVEFVPAIKKWADNYDCCISEASKLSAFYNFGKTCGVPAIKKRKNLLGGNPTAVVRRTHLGGRPPKRPLSSEHTYALAEGKKRKALQCIAACSENNYSFVQ